MFLSKVKLLNVYFFLPLKCYQSLFLCTTLLGAMLGGTHNEGIMNSLYGVIKRFIEVDKAFFYLGEWNVIEMLL